MLRSASLAGAGVVTLAGVLAGCASAADQGGAAGPTGPASTPASLPASQSSPASPRPGSPGHPPPSSRSAAPSPAEGARFTMPNEVGRVLQDAQDDLQRVSHDPVFYTSSKDATGRGRHQLVDRDWKVCAQNVSPGRVVERETVLITFSVVKLDESCP